MNKKYCITFAGALGTSKSPIASFLSYNLNLPVMTNDIIRTEVTEDLGEFDDAEYLSRRDARLYKLLEKGIPFIFDASVDRYWDMAEKRLLQYDYKHFVISIDISREHIEELYRTKGYDEDIDRYVSQHESFLNVYNDIIDLHITDDMFKDRLEISLRAAEAWIASDSTL